MVFKRAVKYDIAPQLYDSGMSIQDCAEYFGITRQAMHKMLERRGVQFRSNLKYGKDNHFFRDDNIFSSVKKRAHHIVERAIEKNILIQNPCEVCNADGVMADGRREVQAHHDDYSRPLDVRWLCQQHHHEWHKENKAKGCNEPAKADRPDLICGGFP